MHDDQDDETTSNTTDACATCPRCRLRRGLTHAILTGDGDDRELLLDRLLDAVESVRAFNVADIDEEPDVAASAAEEVVLLIDTINRMAEPDDQDEDG